jgi:type 1 glutamine amidotransferase
MTRNWDRDALRLLCLLALILSWASLFSTPALGASPARVVLMIGEDEYKTLETLPEFAKTELEPRGMQVTVMQQDSNDKNNFPGLVEALSKADLLVLSVRRRIPPKEQMDAVRAYLDAGKPLVGIRTACHAFAPLANAKGKPVKDVTAGPGWPEFDPQVLGGHYTNHYPPGPKVFVSLAGGANGSPILKDVDPTHLVGNGSLYKINGLDPSCTPLLMGAIPEKPAEPIAWTHLYGPRKGRVFYTTLGHPDDFKEPAFCRLLLNGILWATERPPAK